MKGKVEFSKNASGFKISKQGNEGIRVYFIPSEVLSTCCLPRLVITS